LNNWSLFAKEIQLELRRQTALSGLLLYLFSTVFVCYLTLGFHRGVLSPVTWSAFFWITILFTTISAGAKSFMGERKGREVYYYAIASPGKIIVSKIAYNFLLISLLSFSGFFLFTVFVGNPIQQLGIFLLLVLLASFGFAASLTVLAGLSAKANNGGVLMAVLSFPLVIAILSLSIRVTKNCIDGIDPSASADELLTLAAVDAIAASLSYVLFPFVWRS
jgi:heme exporter protein B